MQHHAKGLSRATQQSCVGIKKRESLVQHAQPDRCMVYELSVVQSAVNGRRLRTVRQKYISRVELSYNVAESRSGVQQETATGAQKPTR